MQEYREVRASSVMFFPLLWAASSVYCFAFFSNSRQNLGLFYSLLIAGPLAPHPSHIIFQVEEDFPYHRGSPLTLQESGTKMGLCLPSPPPPHFASHLFTTNPGPYQTMFTILLKIKLVVLRPVKKPNWLVLNLFVVFDVTACQNWERRCRLLQVQNSVSIQDELFWMSYLFRDLEEWQQRRPSRKKGLYSIIIDLLISVSKYKNPQRENLTVCILSKHWASHFRKQDFTEISQSGLKFL